MRTKQLKYKKNGIETTVDIAVEAKNVETDPDHQFVSQDKITDWDQKPGPFSPITDNTVAFSEAAVRENINSGEKLSVLFGKIRKFLSDLKPHAFSDPVNHCLATTPGSPLDAVQGKTITDLLSLYSGDCRLTYETGKFYIQAGADTASKKQLGEPGKKMVKIGNYEIGYQATADFDVKALLPDDYSRLTKDNFYLIFGSCWSTSYYDNENGTTYTPSLEYDQTTGVLKAKEIHNYNNNAARAYLSVYAIFDSF